MIIQTALFNHLKNSSTSLHSIIIASYYSIMRLAAKIVNYAKNRAIPMTTGIYNNKAASMGGLIIKILIIFSRFFLKKQNQM